jgi:uncharacterized protein involved in exopolysaccharide biosynthesis
MTDLSTPSPRPPGATEAPSRDDDLIRVGAILAAIARGWWIMALTIVACVVLAWHYAVNVATPIYRATASIVLETDDTVLHQISTRRPGRCRGTRCRSTPRSASCAVST